ncbi:hypothetical protein BpHYR1_012796 [Brachionus plicatilis]|uniref:Uncharacterized protein n=1 Tax=Brachionus plicatilis TaxID=10195 RepID=A0A3M7PRF5_BRAPC|nr:hypothetical protein BpHYR1_038643 [Brachionus plicatilis]RNA14199.1 hypothetical protein BpHYR1_012796 [Brachionus plicatilis]
MFNGYPSAPFAQPSFGQVPQFSSLGSSYPSFDQTAAWSTPQFSAAQTTPLSYYPAQSSFPTSPQSYGSYPGFY